MDEAGVANRASQLSGDMIAPGFDVVFVAVGWGAALGDSYYDTMLMDMSVFEAGLQAEEEAEAIAEKFLEGSNLQIGNPGNFLIPAKKYI